MRAIRIFLAARSPSRYTAAPMKNSTARAVAFASLLSGAVAAAAPRAVDIEFKVPPGFAVERACPASRSIIAMTFDGAGRVFLSVERGPILVAADKDGDGMYETVSTFTEEIGYCMGLLWVGPGEGGGPKGTLFAVGDGPVGEGKQGHGVYRLTDSDGDLKADRVELFAPVSEMGEHGTHAVVLGADRHLYIAVGNHSSLAVPFAADSPLLRGYEGSILPPYYDPNGHAIGCRYPGGIVARVDLAGKHWTYFSVGYRNHYDIAFNSAGDLFTFDSDMEWDCGLPWYRPVRVIHVAPASDYGWRTSSYNWQPYCFDSLPAMADVGRGSPTGVAVYEHHRFPERYRGAVIVLDWSQGRVFAVHPKREGATYTGESELFISGKPQFNVTDAEVGPDGALYFTTGGRNVIGTLYRMTYKGADLPPPPPDAADDVEKAIRMPQPSSAWARERVRALRERVGASWGTSLEAAARDSKRPAADRLRAVDLLRLFGPAPDARLIADLARDADGSVRAHAAGVIRDDALPGMVPALTALLDDADPHACRRACEALGGVDPSDVPYGKLYALLGHPDRWIRSAARTALERTVGTAPLRDAILKEADPRRAADGLLLLARAAMPPAPPSPPPAGAPPRTLTNAPWAPPAPLAADPAVFAKVADLLRGEVAPDALLDLLRATEVAIHLQGDAPPPIREKLAAAILAWFPHADARLTREMAVLIAYWAPPGGMDKLLGALRPDLPHEEQIYLAYCARATASPWTLEQKQRLLDWFESASAWRGGNSFRGYIDAMLRACLDRVTPAEATTLIKRGTVGPVMFSVLLPRLDPKELGDLVETLKSVYARIEDGADPEAAAHQRESILLGLAKLAHPALEDWFRKIHDADPRQRDAALTGLAAFKNPADWARLVDGASRPRSGASVACTQALLLIGRAPEDPAVYRRVIDAGRALGFYRGEHLLPLLTHWTKRPAAKVERHQWGQALQDWEDWVDATYGGAAAATAAAQGPAWSFDAIGAFLARSAPRKGSPARGAAIYKKARCAECHRLGETGGGVGPDLNGLTRRFNDGQILESIVYPSRVVSDQFRAMIVNTQDGRVFEGRVVEDTPQRFVMIQTDGQKVTIEKNEVFTTMESKTSLMPEGLLAPFTLEDVKDLFAVLASDGQVQAGEAQAPGWEPLFGKDLAGWTGDAALWKIENGTLVGRAADLAKNGYLVSKATFRDFELAVDVRLAGENANSGVQYRSTVDPAKVDPAGYQADIGREAWGSIYATDERSGVLAAAKPDVARQAVDPNGWNHYVVRADGDRHVLEINGLTTVEAQDGKHREGLLAFQLHAHSKMDVRFANARIRRLVRRE